MPAALRRGTGSDVRGRLAGPDTSTVREARLAVWLLRMDCDVPGRAAWVAWITWVVAAGVLGGDGERPP